MTERCDKCKWWVKDVGRHVTLMKCYALPPSPVRDGRQTCYSRPITRPDDYCSLFAKQMEEQP